MTGTDSGGVQDQGSVEAQEPARGTGGAALQGFVPVDPGVAAPLVALGLFRAEAFLTSYHCPW